MRANLRLGYLGSCGVGGFIRILRDITIDNHWPLVLITCLPLLLVVARVFRVCSSGIFVGLVG